MNAICYCVAAVASRAVAYTQLPQAKTGIVLLFDCWCVKLVVIVHKPALMAEKSSIARHMSGLLIDNQISYCVPLHGQQLTSHVASHANTSHATFINTT